MRIRNPIFIIIIVITCPRAGFSLESPANSNPLGLGTVPPTAYQSGLIPSINPIDTRGNMVITGNVTGGRQFRGVVPYSSPTDFSAPASSLSHTSAAFDSFLRATEGSQAYQQAGSGLTPYYSPSFTVTRTIPGSGGMVTTPAGGGYQATQYYGDLSQGQALRPDTGQVGYYQAGRQFLRRPLSMNVTDMEQSLEADATKYTPGTTPVAEAQSQEQFWRDMGVRMSRKTEPSRTEVTNQPKSTEPNIGFYLGNIQGNQLNVSGQEMNQSTQLITVTGREGVPKHDVYEQMKIQLGKAAKTREETAKSGAEPVTGQTDSNTLTTGARTEISKAEAEGILSSYKSFAAYSNDRFNKHMRAAENYMKQGRYYRAADAYTLATVYEPENPLGYAGKSIALFATGEYMSSALFLSRTLEIFPEYAKFRVDLIAMVGDKDTVENRIIEARDWAVKSDSGELDFLLSYVFYQMDRMEFARQAIEMAAKRMPDSKAVAAMKKAIDERLGKQ